ncbi:hypothetical protein [Bradyrhizobium denitrificans]|jgi:hypothetical protein|uniref:hypothetical protein n=1 Tax=Bradyrhizobium denitrificans TaxID=2734912 RepID=UPI00155532F2|nr:hypothetical protein [Bradyrhizobium sp. LMG 8443]NPU23934.1 hypothetical protein [Bradyrhizobium sp. LMG 8443]
MITLTEFEAQLRAAIVSVKPRLEIGLDKVGSLALSLAAEYPGHYQPGWAPLAESTLKDKTAKGFAVPSPLKRTGQMAASFAKELVPTELTVVIGSPEKVALWQEMGTSRIPPRPVAAKAMRNAIPYAADVFGEIAVALLMGKALYR